MYTNTCNFCGQTFEHDKQGTICRACWYNGEAHVANFPKTMAALKKINADAGVWHTGGGTFHFYVPIGERASDDSWARYVLINDEYWEFPEEETDNMLFVAGYYDENQSEDSNCLRSLGMEEEVGTGVDINTLRAWILAQDAIDEVKRDYPMVTRFVDLHEIIDANELLFPAFEIERDEDLELGLLCNKMAEFIDAEMKLTTS